MSRKNDRKIDDTTAFKHQFNILLLEQDEDYAGLLKTFIENQLPALVSVVRTVENARQILNISPNKFFICIASVLNLDSSEFEKVDLLDEFNVPVIAVVNEFEDHRKFGLVGDGAALNRIDFAR